MAMATTAQADDLLLFESRLKAHHDYYVAVRRRYIALCVALGGANVYNWWQWAKALELHGRVCWSSTACSLAVILASAACVHSRELRTQARVPPRFERCANRALEGFGLRLKGGHLEFEPRRSDGGT